MKKIVIKDLEPGLTYNKVSAVMGIIAASRSESEFIVRPVPRGAFKYPYQVFADGQLFFLAVDKSRYESRLQSQMHALKPNLFPGIIAYGDAEGVTYSLEEWIDMEPVKAIRENQAKVAYALGVAAGDLYSTTKAYSEHWGEEIGYIHYDPGNIHLRNPVSNFDVVYIDLGYFHQGNLHDLLGVSITRVAGESELELTIRHPEEFLCGLSEGAGISLELLKKAASEVPTQWQYLNYMARGG